MFMFCRLAMMKEFLFMSGLEQPSHTHTHTHTPRPSATHTHTHSWLPSQDETSPMNTDLLFCHGGLLVVVVKIFDTSLSSSMRIWDHVKGFYCSPAAWLWSLLLSFSLFEPYVWPDFSFPIFFFFVVTGIMMWFIHVGVPMPGAFAISPTSLLRRPAATYVAFRMLVNSPGFLTSLTWKTSVSTCFTTNSVLVNHLQV